MKTALGLTMAVAVASACPAMAAPEMVTGAVVYDLTLEDKGGMLSGVTGSMTAQMTRDCDTYWTESSLSAEFEGPTGAMTMEMSSVVSETADSLGFDILGKFASIEVDRAEGTATRTEDGVSVALSEPETGTHTVAGDVVFPLGMITGSIAAAKAGESLASFVVYDGSGHGRDVWLVSVIIGAPMDPASDEDEEALFAAGLGFADMARWRMVFSYFPREASGDQTPVFTSTAVVYENGFVQAASYDFGEFAIRLTLEEFSPIPPTPCP